MTLENQYRRLLLAYPGRYRRAHGSEIVTTLLEMSGDGQTRPSRSDAWHLFVSGLRQRFRLPARPLVWVAAALIVVIGGGFGSAAASWAAEQTFASLPDDTTLMALTHQAAGGGDEYGSTSSSSPWWTPYVSGVVDRPGWTPEPARQTLAADGWQVGAIRDLGGASYDADPVTGAMVQVPMRGTQFDAVRDGRLMRVTGYVTADRGTISVMVSPADTGTMRPLTLAGVLLGLIGGWLLAAAGAYRLLGQPGPVRRRVAAVLSALAIAALVVPAFAFYINLMRVLAASGDLVNTVHSALNRSPYWSYSTPWMLLQLTIGGAVLAVAAWLVTGRRDPVSGLYIRRRRRAPSR
ncbi:hypothetical protein BJ973_002004 [Actinoplanes tereljensis]|uniref:Uncharacterized protein n=1 Tax=Paractinoplanes tereljensis TaxID=571912 RepID=A0A919TT71_9ACTN|nr:hypothetical protein [Actinoplanes tereljensis]GIF20090.1 hypothetical protein Ate02nite_28200 [Actinoplanes tereljensis]